MTRLSLSVLALALAVIGCDATTEPVPLDAGPAAAEVGASSLRPSTGETFGYSGYDGLNLEFDLDTQNATSDQHGVTILGSRPSQTSLETYTRFQMTPAVGTDGYDLTVYWPGVETTMAHLCLYTGDDVDSLEKDDCFEVHAAEMGATSGVTVANIQAPWGGVSGGDGGRIKSAHTNGQNGGVDYPRGPGEEPFPYVALTTEVSINGRAARRANISHIYLEFDHVLSGNNSIAPNTIQVRWKPGATFELLKKGYVTN